MENETKTCPFCGEEIRAAAIRCRYCQADLGMGAGTPPGGVGAPISGEIRAGVVLAGKYRIDGELGRGGMAVVYRAWDLTLERPVALKVLPHQYAFDRGFVERFIREARSAAKLQHPNIITIFEAGESGGINFIAMALVEGQTLSERMTRGLMDEEESKRITAKLALALNHAHGHGLVHRDIKPSNIILRHADGEPLLMDFGIARAIEGGKLTRTGTAIGTPEYMSPEQIEGREVSPSSDLYSLGIVLYKMLTGEEPFTGPTTSVLYRHVHEAPTPANEKNPSVSAATAEIVNKLISKNPGERFQSGRDLAAALGFPGKHAATASPGASAEPTQVVAGAGVQAVSIEPTAVVPQAPGTSETPSPKTAEEAKKRGMVFILAGIIGLLGVTAIVLAIALPHARTGGGGGGPQPPVCSPNAYRDCRNGDVYNFDSCNNPGSVYENCPVNSQCNGGSCQCLSGYKMDGGQCVIEISDALTGSNCESGIFIQNSRCVTKQDVVDLINNMLRDMLRSNGNCGVFIDYYGSSVDFYGKVYSKAELRDYLNRLLDKSKRTSYIYKSKSASNIEVTWKSSPVPYAYVVYFEDMVHDYRNRDCVLSLRARKFLKLKAQNGSLKIVMEDAENKSVSPYGSDCPKIEIK